jgi:hypothetical protein
MFGAVTGCAFEFNMLYFCERHLSVGDCGAGSRLPDDDNAALSTFELQQAAKPTARKSHLSIFPLQQNK